MGKNFVNSRRPQKDRRLNYKNLRKAGYTWRQATRMRDWTDNHLKSVLKLKPKFPLLQ